MNTSLETIPFARLTLLVVPAAIVLGILFRWSVGGRTALYALSRMVAQLILVGYVLTFIFQSDRASVVGGTLCVMLLAASWITLRPIRRKRMVSYLEVLVSISVGGVATLVLVTHGVLQVEGWHQASVVIPLAGMVFSTSMNTVSLAAERYHSETARGAPYAEARQIAIRAAMIPLINTLLAVGLVSFPGMMTGQILSGVSPLVAVRYQILVMSMLFGSAGICAASYLLLQGRHLAGAEP